MEIVQIIWLALVIILVIVEASTTALVSIWFCVGALVALLISLIWPGAIWVQVAACLVVSAVALWALRPLARRLLGSRRVPTNADANIGKIGRVTKDIQPGHFGRVKLEGLEWTARADVALPAGAWCRVDAIEGVKLVVSSVPNPAENGPAKAD